MNDYDTNTFVYRCIIQILEENGVQNYMQYADSKLREEEQRARRYLDTKSDSLDKVIIIEINLLHMILKLSSFFSAFGTLCSCFSGRISRTSSRRMSRIDQSGRNR